MITNSLYLKSPAKINLYLKILKKRLDGFHDIDSAFQLIDLYDEIEIINIDSNEIKIICDPSIIKKEDNIVFKAVKALKKDYRIDKGVQISLKKNIPIGEINTVEKVMQSETAKSMVLEEIIENKKTKRIKTVAFELTS